METTVVCAFYEHKLPALLDAGCDPSPIVVHLRGKSQQCAMIAFNNFHLGINLRSILRILGWRCFPSLVSGSASPQRIPVLGISFPMP